MPKRRNLSAPVVRSPHCFTDQALTIRASKGDLEAQQILRARDRVRIMTMQIQPENLRSYRVFLSPDVCLLFQQREGAERWLTMSIVVSKDRSINHLRDEETWNAIKQWRRFLSEWQGPWLHGGDEALFYRLFVMQQQKNGNAKLGQRLNQVAATYLKQYVQDCNLFMKSSALFANELDALYWEADQSREDNYKFRRGLSAARNLMITMGLSSKDAQKWCDEAIDSFKDGKEKIWQSSGPLAPKGKRGELVRSRIRRFKEDYQSWIENRKR